MMHFENHVLHVGLLYMYVPDRILALLKWSWKETTS